MKILFLARSLDVGGAERQLVVLTAGLRRKGHLVKVAIFYEGGPLELELNASDVPVIHLNKKGRWDILGFLVRLIRAIRQEAPDVIYGWMIIPNVILAFLKPFFPSVYLVWGIRTSYLNMNLYAWPPRLAYRLEVWLSRWANLIICNSWAGMEYSLKHGLPGKKMLVIPNGIDVQYFKHNPEAGKAVREGWHVREDEKLIGLVARLDPLKDHPIFLRAAALLKKEHPNLRFVCIGDGPDPYKTDLMRLAESLDLGDCLTWAGERLEMPAVYNALDILVSSSAGEGFPNSVGEAMACGIPCVVTDVGDAARIVGGTGVIISPKDQFALQNGVVSILECLETDRNFDAGRIRDRIVDNYNVELMVLKTIEVLEVAER